MNADIDIFKDLSRISPTDWLEDDIFVRGGDKSINDADLFYKLGFLAITILMVVGYFIDPNVASYALIFLLIIGVIWYVILYSHIDDNNTFSFIAFGSNDSVTVTAFQFIFGLGIALLILYGSFLSINLKQLAITPFSVSSVVAGSSLLSYVVLVIFGPLIEQDFIAAITATFGRLTDASRTPATLLLIILSLVIMFFGGYIIGITAIYVGIILFGAAMLISKIFYSSFIKPATVLDHIFALFVLAVPFIIILHTYSYKIVDLTSFINAAIPIGFIFGTQGLMDWFFQSTVAGKAMHMQANASALIALGALDIVSAELMVIAGGLYLIGIYYVSQKLPSR